MDDSSYEYTHLSAAQCFASSSSFHRHSFDATQNCQPGFDETHVVAVVGSITLPIFPFYSQTQQEQSEDLIIDSDFLFSAA